MKPNLTAIFLSLALSISASPAWSDFADGLQAYDGGDYAFALENWRPLADAGDADAQAALAGMYVGGVGVAQNFRRAVRWYEAAARQGHVQAQLNLGELYAEGRGVPRDPIQGLKWLGIAAATGHPWAVAASKELEKSLNEAERKEAKRLINNWRSE